MIWNAMNGVIRLNKDTMHYVRFGCGSRTVIMLPGLGDGLTTVKGMAVPMAWMYRAFAKEYTVYLFSRRNQLTAGTTTRDMARDLKDAMDALQIDRADLIGVSMGGMIAQHFAADFPERVGKLVLAATCAQPNDVLNASVNEWMELARRGDHTALMDSNVRRIYSDAYYRRNRWMIHLMGRFTKPASYERFLIQADACLTHHASERLGQIVSPVLVIGGEQDNAVGAAAPHEMAAAIPGASLRMYPEWGHGLYEEAKDFQQVILDFLREK